MINTGLMIKRSIKSVLSAAKIRGAFPAAAAGDVNILAYHRVVADIRKAEKEAIYGTVVSAETFWKHCEALRKSFDVVSLETAGRFLESGQKAARPLAVITFDDGYLDFYEEAFPILNEFGFPATVFLPTAFIGKPQPLSHDRIYWLVKQSLEKSVSLHEPLAAAGVSKAAIVKMLSSPNVLKITDLIVHLANDLRENIISEMERALGGRFENYPPEYELLDWRMVREMSGKGIGFGSHTARHVILPLEKSSTLEKELADSKTLLEKEIGESVTMFAYPNGEFNDEIKQLVAEAGYKIAVTTKTNINRPGADLLALGRISLCEESTRGIKGTFSARVADLRLGV